MHKSPPRTKEQAQQFLRSLGLLKRRRVLEGTEREQVLTMLSLVESEVTNNQRFWTETWRVGNTIYHLTTGEGIDELEEVIDDYE